MNFESEVAQPLTSRYTLIETRIDEQAPPSPSPSPKPISRLRRFLSLKSSKKYKIKNDQVITTAEKAHKINTHRNNAIMPYNDSNDQNANTEMLIFTEGSESHFTEILGVDLLDLKKLRKDKENINGPSDQRKTKDHFKICIKCRKFAYHKNNTCMICENISDRSADRCGMLLASFCCCILSIGS